ncbi:MAG: response regulator transcription factor [Myxococcota bacterium]
MTGGRAILIVEDDDAIASGLSLNLRLEGFLPHIVQDGDEVMAWIQKHEPVLMLLDITLPNRDGLEILREIRENGRSLPVIVLSARQGEFDKVAALRLGADDYVTKPFALAELLARVEAVLRRAGVEAPSTAIHFGPVTVRPHERRVVVGDEEIRLTHLEYELLLYLVRRPNQVVSREELLQNVWGVRVAGSRRTVDNFVAQLRQKLGEDPENARYLQTVRGSGYRFVP